MLPIAQIKPCTVQWTHDFVAVNIARNQGNFLMRTPGFHRIKLLVLQLKQANLNVLVDLYVFPVRMLELTDGTYFYPLTHDCKILF